MTSKKTCFCTTPPSTYKDANLNDGRKVWQIFVFMQILAKFCFHLPPAPWKPKSSLKRLYGQCWRDWPHICRRSPGPGRSLPWSQPSPSPGTPAPASCLAVASGQYWPWWGGLVTDWSLAGLVLVSGRRSLLGTDWPWPTGQPINGLAGCGYWFV